MTVFQTIFAVLYMVLLVSLIIEISGPFIKWLVHFLADFIRRMYNAYMKPTIDAVFGHFKKSEQKA